MGQATAANPAPRAIEDKDREVERRLFGVSWNFRHMVNWRRIRAYNEVNRQNGYAAIDIRTPEEIDHD